MPPPNPAGPHLEFREQILGAFREAGAPLTAGELARITGINFLSLSGALSRDGQTTLGQLVLDGDLYELEGYPHRYVLSGRHTEAA